ncbi:MAG: hypothetical protein IT382_16035, partial [Deltaproteobacteria bacterium]|nr:hypothetical protein [Deltaproteobacteria bacterium]
MRLVVIASSFLAVLGTLAGGCATTHEANWNEKPAAAATPEAAGAATGALSEGDEL